MIWTAFLVFAVALSGGVAWRQARVRRAFARLRAATHAGEVELARREVFYLARRYAHHKPTLVVLRLTEASLLVHEERFTEARTLLESIDSDELQAAQLPYHEAELARCLIHTGEAERAIELSHMAAWRTQNVNPQFLPYCRAVIGEALLAAGRAMEAVAILRETLAAPEVPSHSAALCAFQLGEALRALGRNDEAQQAYDRARRALPGSRWSSRAEERLKTLAAQSPYR